MPVHPSSSKQSFSSPVFNTNTKLEYLLCSLECYRAALSNLHDKFNSQYGQDLPSEALLMSLHYNFRHTLSDAFFLLNNGLNELHYSGLNSALLSEFSNEFVFYIHHKPSSEIQGATDDLLLYHAKISVLSLFLEHFKHFVQEHQEIKRLALCGFLMHAARQTSLKVFAEGLTDSFERFMDELPGVGTLHDAVCDNAVAEAVEEFYKNCELLRDFFEVGENSINALMQTEEASADDHHHGSYSAELRVKSAINLIFCFIFSILGIQSLRSIAIDRQYNNRQIMQVLVIPYISTLSVVFALSVLLSNHLKLLSARLLSIMTVCSALSFFVVIGLILLSPIISISTDVSHTIVFDDLPIDDLSASSNIIETKPFSDKSDSGVGTSVSLTDKASTVNGLLDVECLQAV